MSCDRDATTAEFIVIEILFISFQIEINHIISSYFQIIIIIH